MMDSLELQVRQWATDKGIFEGGGNALAQMDKAYEELLELDKEVTLKEERDPEWSNRKIQLELGDVLVTMVVQSHIHGLSLTSCLQAALDKITKRNGKMVGGQFVKDE